MEKEVSWKHPLRVLMIIFISFFCLSWIAAKIDETYFEQERLRKKSLMLSFGEPIDFSLHIDERVVDGGAVEAAQESERNGNAHDDNGNVYQDGCGIS